MTTYRLLTLVQQATTARQLAFSAEYEAFVADLTAKAFPSDPEIVHIMLALVTSLAITRYSRAEQMLSVAEPKAAEEHQESLQEARLWLAAGRIVCSCSQESRDLWDHRLRRKIWNLGNYNLV